MHLHVARELESECRRLCVTPLFNHLFAQNHHTSDLLPVRLQFIYSPATQQVCFCCHLFNSLSFTNRLQAHAALSTRPTLPHTCGSGGPHNVWSEAADLLPGGVETWAACAGQRQWEAPCEINQDFVTFTSNNKH